MFINELTEKWGTKVPTIVPQPPSRGPIRLPALRFFQGGRTVYLVAPPLRQLLELTPAREEGDRISEANRRLNRRHALELADYLWTEPEWVSGPMLLGIRKGEVAFTPYKGDQEVETSGTLTILPKVDGSHLVLFDGQHRRFALHALIERTNDRILDLRHRAAHSPSDERSMERMRERLDTILSESIPMMVFEENEIDHLRQMFADAGQAIPPDAVTLARFDTRNPFNSAALRLASEHALLTGRVELERSTLTARSPHLMTLNQLSKNILRTIFVGVQGRLGKRTLADLTEDEIFQRGYGFLNDLIDSYADFQLLVASTTTVRNLRAEYCLLVYATIQRVIAGIWYELRHVRHLDGRQFRAFMASNVPARTNDEVDGFWQRSGILPPGDFTTPVARMQEIREAVRVAVQLAERGV